MKKLSALLLAVVMVLSLAACGGNSAPAATEAPAATTEAPAADAPAAAGPVEFTGKLTAPLAVISCGQSPGATMLNVVATQAKLTSVCDNGMTVETLPAGTKTLIITMGTSGKGMGAAGTDVNDEIARCTEVAQAAKAAGMLIVVAHVEGMSRRTDANDQASIDAMLPFADVIVCVADSDSDGLFTNYANEHNIPLIVAPDTLSLSAYME